MTTPPSSLSLAEDVQTLLSQLAERRPKRIDLGLDRVKWALSRVGNPQDHLPATIHVAGTNGKGSTIAYMRSILAAAGLKVHVYTSPHLVRFHERIVLAGEEIDDKTLISALGRCDAAAGEEPLTYFEAVTCAAFLAFAETPADVVLLETGLGGRLDATNVIEAPRACVISPIGMDHMDWLGDTIEDIAREKAGIIKQGCPVVIGKQSTRAGNVLRDRALALGAETFSWGEEYSAFLEEGHLIYQEEEALLDLSLPRMLGAHQIENAGLAVAALKVAGLAPDADIISKGIEQAFWPGRLQRLTHGPLIEQARKITGEDVEIWLDGGHNAHGAKVVARAMADLEELRPRPLVLISGLQANKDAASFFAPFVDLAAAVFTVQSTQDAAADAEKVAVLAQHAGLPATATHSIDGAFEAALTASQEGTPRILICGSLYLAGDILRENG